MSTVHAIRCLHSDDVNQALELSTVAGWNQTAEDWQLLVDLAADGSFCVEVGGTVVATATLISYGARLGVVGMVLTHPEYRRRGFAKQLLTYLLETATAAGINTLKLDATDQGEPLYRSMGFQNEQTVERWWRAGSPDAEATTVTYPPDISHWLELDLEVFGADRSFLLERLAQNGTGFTNAGGFLLSRAGRLSKYLGPCIAANADAARDLFRAAIERPAPGWFWDILPENRDAAELAAALGFSPQRRLTRMVRGPGLPSQDSRVYAIAGFEFG